MSRTTHKTATLEQGKKILAMLEGVPRAQVQAALTFLPDFLAGKLDELRKQDLRRVLGLHPTACSDDGDRKVPVLHVPSTGYTFELVPVLQGPIETGINNFVLAERARNLEVERGEGNAERLYEAQEKIPLEWSRYRLVFPAQYSDGYVQPSVFILYQRDLSWTRGCVTQSLLWSPTDRFVRGFKVK